MFEIPTPEAATHWSDWRTVLLRREKGDYRTDAGWPVLLHLRRPAADGAAHHCAASNLHKKWVIRRRTVHRAPLTVGISRDFLPPKLPQFRLSDAEITSVATFWRSNYLSRDFLARKLGTSVRLSRDYLTPNLPQLQLSDAEIASVATFWRRNYLSRNLLTPKSPQSRLSDAVTTSAVTFCRRNYLSRDFLTPKLSQPRLSDAEITSVATFWRWNYLSRDFLTSKLP